MCPIIRNDENILHRVDEFEGFEELDEIEELDEYEILNEAEVLNLHEETDNIQVRIIGSKL